MIQVPYYKEWTSKVFPTHLVDGNMADAINEPIPDTNPTKVSNGDYELLWDENET